MPGFRVHITGSSIAGAAYGAAAWYAGGLPPMTCALGGGLCAVAGMMPDLDSGPGAPLRESVAFAAAVVPIMMIHRFQQMGLPTEAIILLGAAIYLAVRFGLSWLLEQHSHHRGMFHSLPAAAIAGQVTFLAFAAEEPLRRYFVSSAVVLGFLTHLVLDEIWSVKMGWFGPKVKKSFGTALKFHGPELWPNLITYALALVLGGLAAGDAAWTERVAHVRQQMEQATRTFPYQPQYPQQWQYRR
ncbi:MAG: metal-dependent hydrolase [Planctomycetaceae bacterium]